MKVFWINAGKNFGVILSILIYYKQTCMAVWYSLQIIGLMPESKIIKTTANVL